MLVRNRLSFRAFRASASALNPSPINSSMKEVRRGIAVEQPAAEGDAVGLVVEFLRVELVKVVQLRIL